MMGDITSKRVLYFKGGLFLALGVLAAAIALARYPDWRLAALMAIAIWAFCRAYYFAFYVIEHYVDPSFKFAGLGAFVRHCLQQRRIEPRWHGGHDDEN
jgi:hypothetical protein